MRIRKTLPASRPSLRAANTSCRNRAGTRPKNPAAGKSAKPAAAGYSKQEHATAGGQKAAAANVINGLVRDVPGRLDNRWAAEMTPDGAWIELAWDKPQTIRQVQITFDSGFHRQLTLSSSDSTSATVIRAPQPETVRDYTLSYRKPGGGGELIEWPG